MGRAGRKSTKSLLDVPAKYFKRRHKPAAPEEQQGLDEALRAFGKRVVWGDEAVAWGDVVVQRDVVAVPRLGPAFEEPPKRRRAWQRDPIRAVIDKKWGPGWPPDTLATPEALRQLDHELDRLGIKGSEDTKKRAMGRRD